MADVFNKNPSSFVDMNELFPVLNERTGLTSEQFKKVVENLIYVYNNLASGGSGGGVVFTPSVDDNGNLSWTNNGGLENPTTVNIRGATGATGAAAGFGTPTASVDGNTGTPSVTVTASGEDTAKVFNFEFKNLKGEKGDTGAQGVGTPGVTPNISVTATQLPSDAQPTATRSGTDENPIITFGIPSGGSENALVKPSTPPNVIEIVGIDTNGNQVRIQVDTNDFEIDGTTSPYTLKKKAEPQPETWIINNDAFANNVYDSKTYTALFNSNSQTFNSIIINHNPKGGGMFYDSTKVVDPDNAFTFINQAYRTVTFETAPTGELLTWLQANAVKQ